MAAEQAAKPESRKTYDFVVVGGGVAGICAAVTAAQNAVTYFPEFGYESYWRLLEAEISGRSMTFQFKANPYSTYNRRTHFTPIWDPDGSYTPYTWLLDCWTPAGMLSMNLTDRVTIRGNLWEEWHIAPTKQR